MSLQIVFSVLARGSISDIAYIISFIREFKRDVIDANPRFRFCGLFQVYIVYMVHLLEKKWHVPEVARLIAPHLPRLEEESSREALELLRNTSLDIVKVEKVIRLADDNKLGAFQVNFDKINSKLIEYFVHLTNKREEDLGMSFEKISNMNELDNIFIGIVNTFCTICSFS